MRLTGADRGKRSRMDEQASQQGTLTRQQPEQDTAGRQSRRHGDRCTVCRCRELYLHALHDGPVPSMSRLEQVKRAHLSQNQLGHP